MPTPMPTPMPDLMAYHPLVQREIIYRKPAIQEKKLVPPKPPMPRSMKKSKAKMRTRARQTSMSVPQESTFSFEDHDADKVLNALVSKRKIDGGYSLFGEIWERVKVQEPYLIIRVINNLKDANFDGLRELDHKMNTIARQIYFEE